MRYMRSTSMTTSTSLLASNMKDITANKSTASVQLYFLSSVHSMHSETYAMIWNKFTFSYGVYGHTTSKLSVKGAITKCFRTFVGT